VSEPEYAESVGTTLEDAIEKALEVLEAREDEVDVEILEEGKRGFLGFGTRRPFRVRVTWSEDPTEEILVGDLAPTDEESSGSTPSSGTETPARREWGAGRIRSLAPESRETTSEFVELTPDAARKLEAEAEEVTAVFLDLMALEAEVETSVTIEGIRIDLQSDRDEALLIGKRGETRAALQHILNRILSRRTGSFVPIHVDIANYWERRVDRLTREAGQLADRAVLEGVGTQSEPLPPQERRIIHRALLDDARVTTESVGKGLHKSVLIQPNQQPSDD
jgi:spoIIIJ-associated protein